MTVIDQQYGPAGRLRNAPARIGERLSRGNVLGPDDDPAGPGPPVISRRATVDDCDLVADSVLAAFGYVYGYVFGTDAADRNRGAVVAMLRACRGRGASGVCNYQFIVDGRTGTRVGLFRLDAVRRPTIWTVAEAVLLPVALVRALRTVRLAAVWRRSRAVFRSQPLSAPDDVRLTQLIVFEPFRSRGYGTAFLRRLQRCLLTPPPAGPGADRVSLYTRSENAAAVALFRRAGFAAVPPAADDRPPVDPVAAAGLAGDLILMASAPAG